MIRTRFLLGAALLATPALAQQPAFQTPGMPNWSASGQVDRFSNASNPAFGAILDAFADYRSVPGPSDDEGLDLFVRSFEMTMNGRVDPNWWGYGVVVYADDEVELEEAAVTYSGFESNTTVRFGRFFVDFGKQMQGHIHDLPYPDRPGVLAEYLGEELPGVGVQGDHWWVTGDASALRASFGVFGDFELGGHEEDGDDDAVTASIAERKDAEELGLTLRVTQFMDVGDRGVFQWGVSGRHVGGFALENEANGLSTAGLSNTVYGADLTFGIDSDDGLSGWTFGTELLFADGELSAEVNGAATGLDVFDGEAFGLYAWGERRLSQNNSIGVLYSTFEHAEAGDTRSDEITAYWSHYFSEFARLRFSVAHAEVEGDEDVTRGLVQLTTFFGPHAHGVNW